MKINFDPRTTLLIVALEDELPRVLVNNWDVVYCGVGKVNATMTLCDALVTFQPQTVINYGTAGTLQSNLSGLHEVTRFLQRDMDVRAMGFALGQTPFEEQMVIDSGFNGLSCGTGDLFVSAQPEMKTDLVDMEAFALAKVCFHKKVEFRCFKFISDGADADAADDWPRHMAAGADRFVRTILNQ